MTAPRARRGVRPVKKKRAVPTLISPETGEVSVAAKDKYRVVAEYADGALTTLTLVDEDPKYGTSWDDATKKKELARRAAHDKVLIRDLGPAHHRDDAHYYAEWKFPWGEVQSSFTPRDFITQIRILYR